MKRFHLLKLITNKNDIVRPSCCFIYSNSTAEKQAQSTPAFRHSVTLVQIS